MTDRPPFPPFTHETAARKVQTAEDAWNSRERERVSLAYSEGSVWRNRDCFVKGRAEIVAFLVSTWKRELEYALRKNLWTFEENGSRCDSSTNHKTFRVSGGEATAMSYGSSTNMG